MIFLVSGSCGKALRVGERFCRRNHPALRTPPELFGTGSPEEGDLRSLVLGGKFSVDVVLCVDFMAYCCGYGLKINTIELEDISAILVCQIIPNTKSSLH